MSDFDFTIVSMNKSQVLQVLSVLKNDAFEKLMEETEIEKLKWYQGHVNAFSIAIDLICHLQEG